MTNAPLHVYPLFKLHTQTILLPKILDDQAKPIEFYRYSQVSTAYFGHELLDRFELDAQAGTAANPVEQVSYELGPFHVEEVPQLELSIEVEGVEAIEAEINRYIYSLEIGL